MTVPADGIAARKQDHLRVAQGDEVGFATVTTGLERLRLRAQALPERDLAEVDLSQRLWGRDARWPLLVSCMTGGVGQAGAVNRALAVAAQTHGIPLGLGSGRALLEDASRTEGFLVRDLAPDVAILANLGAVQLAEHGVEGCARLVARCEADALVLHLNAVQEAVQPGGDTAFGGVLGRIAAVAEALDVPVIVKEVGFGLGPEDVARLAGAGVDAIDVAGAGGTNWARVEGLRDPRAGDLAAAFSDWGWPTATALRHAGEALRAARRPDITLIGSGGIRDGVDVLKVLCLGARLAGVARGLLDAATRGPAAATDALGTLVEQLRIATWAVGAGRLADLGPHRLSDLDAP